MLTELAGVAARPARLHEQFFDHVATQKRLRTRAGRSPLSEMEKPGKPTSGLARVKARMPPPSSSYSSSAVSGSLATLASRVNNCACRPWLVSPSTYVTRVLQSRFLTVCCEIPQLLSHCYNRARLQVKWAINSRHFQSLTPLARPVSLFHPALAAAA
jgi:hypothetical protein